MSITGLTSVVTAWRVSCKVSFLTPEEQKLSTEGGGVNLDPEGASFIHLGPFQQSLWLGISPCRIPHDPASTGFSSPSMCFHSSGRTCSWISPIRFASKVSKR